VYRLAYNGGVVAFKMSRRQGDPSRTGIEINDPDGRRECKGRLIYFGKLSESEVQRTAI
jgi:hypothetical protein